MDAWEGGHSISYRDKLQVQDSTITNDLPQLYWVMTGDNFTLDNNNPKELKIL